MSQSPRRSVQNQSKMKALAAPSNETEEPSGAPGMYDKHREAIKGAFDNQKVTNEMKIMTDTYIDKKQLGRPLYDDYDSAILV